MAGRRMRWTSREHWRSAPASWPLPSAKIADLRSQIAAKQAEIAAVKGDEGDDGQAASDTVDGNAEEVADPPSGEQEPGGTPS